MEEGKDGYTGGGSSAGIDTQSLQLQLTILSQVSCYLGLYNTAEADVYCDALCFCPVPRQPPELPGLARVEGDASWPHFGHAAAINDHLCTAVV